MDRRDEQNVELFRAYTTEEIREQEAALATSGFFRGDYCCGYLKAV